MRARSAWASRVRGWRSTPHCGRSGVGLAGCAAVDAKGFIKTGSTLTADDLSTAKWPLRRPPHLLETSLPGVLAVGDVRSGSTKRVASAVGEGSIAVATVHQILAE